MNSCQKLAFRAIVVVIVFMIASSQARPAAQSDNDETILHSRLVAAHSRTAASKRHAEIRLSSEMSRRMEELKRIRLLNNIMAGLDTGKVYSIKNSAGERRHTKRRSRKVSQPEAYPVLSAHREVSSELLEQLNDQQLPDGVAMRIVQDQPTEASISAEQFRRYIHKAQHSVALARTCRDMQEMVNRNNLRLRVKCHPVREKQHQQNRNADSTR